LEAFKRNQALIGKCAVPSSPYPLWLVSLSNRPFLLFDLLTEWLRGLGVGAEHGHTIVRVDVLRGLQRTLELPNDFLTLARHSRVTLFVLLKLWQLVIPWTDRPQKADCRLDRLPAIGVFVIII
jgi:hypothetical protein